MSKTTLDWVKQSRPDELRIEHLHWGIVYEARELKRWENGLTLFTDYLGPVIIASQKATAAGTVAAKPGQEVWGASSRVTDFDMDTAGNYTTQLTEHDVRLVQWSIACLVRYANSPAESNRVYGFFLQCELPVRNDETIDNCLISLIYRYAQVKDDPALRAEGVDLVTVALDRGIGLASYNSKKSGKARYNSKGYSESPSKQENILVSVSKPILIPLRLQISIDGQKLEPLTGPTPRPRYQHQNQQQQQTPSQQIAAHQQRQQSTTTRPLRGEPQPPQQRPTEEPPQRVRSGRLGRQAQALYHSQKHLELSDTPSGSGSQNRTVSPQSSQPQSLQSQKEETPSLDATQEPTMSTPQWKKKSKPKKKKGPAEPYVATLQNSLKNEDDQHAYYEKATRRFAGTERTPGHTGRRRGDLADSGNSSRGGGYAGGMELRTIKFVAASTNSMLKTDHHPASELEEDEGNVKAKEATSDSGADVSMTPRKKQLPGVDQDKGSQDAASDLVAGVEKLRLEPKSE